MKKGKNIIKMVKNLKKNDQNFEKMSKILKKVIKKFRPNAHLEVIMINVYLIVS